MPSRIPTPRRCTGEAPSVLSVSESPRVFHVEQTMGAGTDLSRLRSCQTVGLGRR